MDMEKEIQILNIDDILPNRFQPRIQFNDKNINELADSIKEHGVIQPIVVRKVSDKYEIIAGERRYKASILAGKTTIPAIVTNLDDKNSAEIALIENVQRQDLTPIEEAVSYKKILDMGYLNQSALAEKLGKTQSTIANKLRLLNLDEAVQEALLDGKISERHARSLLKLDNTHQLVMLNRIIDERLTVRKTDEEIEKMLNSGIGNAAKEESEEPKMDEKIVNEFHLPTNPIMEEKQENTTDNIENQINPGFMDINKIEETAEDIFKPAPTPAPNVDMLMEEKPVETVNPMAATMQPIVEPEEEAPRGGRFFNMFGITQEEDKNPNYVENVENKETNMDFGIPTSSTPVFNPFMSNDVTNVFNQPNISENPNENVDETSTKDESPILEVPTQNNISTENTNETIFHPVQPYTLNDDTEFGLPEQTIEPAPSEENIATPVVNEQPVETQNFNDQPNIFEDSIQPATDNISSSVNRPQFTTIPPVTPIYDDIPNEESSTNTAVPANDFKVVINTIRDCAKTIENFGYIIDTEEMDFEDSYQVIFKIDKK